MSQTRRSDPIYVLIVMSRVELRVRAVLAVQSGDPVIEVAHRLGDVAAEPAQLHGFGCPIH